MISIRLVKLISLILLLLFISYLAKASSQAVVTNDLTEKPQFVANQLIVQYKADQSPDELGAKVAEREKERASFFGMIRLFLTDLGMKLKGQETPEEKLKQINEVKRQAGVITEEKLFESGDLSLTNFYLLTTDGSLSVSQAVDLYKSLPEVETVEPNYIQRIQKMGI